MWIIEGADDTGFESSRSVADVNGVSNVNRTCVNILRYIVDIFFVLIIFHDNTAAYPFYLTNHSTKLLSQHYDSYSSVPYNKAYP
jgi:hypothetical protein